MLRRLHIRNYLLIEELDLQLEKGLTIITGETGSGKSILIGALALAMGERAGSGALRDPAKRCVIELEVDPQGLDIGAWLERSEVPAEPTLILRRQLEPGGRSRAFVNDTPVRLEQLRELGERLVHVHSQHHTLLLNDPGFQLGLVDHVAGQGKEVHAYSGRYTDWRALHHRLSALRDEEGRSRGEQDFLLFQLEELEAAALVPGEQEVIAVELTKAENAEELTLAYTALGAGAAGEHGLVNMIASLRRTSNKAALHDPELRALLERLEALRIEVKDIGEEAERALEHIVMDPARTESLRGRMDLILRLQQKHRVDSVEALIELREEMRSKVQGIDGLGDRIAELEAEENALSAEVLHRAKEISKARVKALVPLSRQVVAILHELGMPHAVFRFGHHYNEPGPTGIDSVRAIFSANKERAPAPLDKVASGGELSRVMLALISLAADSRDLPTVVFDEIDTGVSGEVADRVGTLMARMGAVRQVLTITHLPQIASKAGTHLVVSKDRAEDVANTSIRAVLAEERVVALAQMLSGRKLSKAALDNARVLLEGGS
ncbi:MAG: DNA repair protein RecN [Flavobacteriales bacterium]|nr:DNA repair protein RecN [Flavobacteriales bacterium]